ncbi:signal peptidase I [Chloroflexota bacterium]
MKRALMLTAIVAACVIGFLSVRGTMSFMAVFGISMEPELHAGNLILIEEISPYDVEVGDIVVFTIPSAVREYYNYPQVVAHRVIKINTSEDGVTFRTKGDNSGEDPFTVRPQDLRGQVSKQIPYLGLPLLFFQSKQGLIFIVVALSLLVLYLYADELGKGRQMVHRGLFAPVIKESRRTSQVMTRKIDKTEQALEKFASAIEVYAQHLQSHTSAVQGLSEASQGLKRGAVEQNKVLTRLMGVMEQPRPEVKEEVKPEVEEVKFPPGCVRSRKKLSEQEIFKAG